MAQSNALHLVCKTAPQFIPRQRYKQQSCLCALLFNLIGSMWFDCSRHKSKSFKCSTWFHFHEERERHVRFSNCEKVIHKISYRTGNFLQVNGKIINTLKMDAKFKRLFGPRSFWCSFLVDENQILRVVENFHQMMSSACNI